MIYQEIILIKNLCLLHFNLKQLIYNDVKKIKLNDLDNGEITISKIEKWKRKVVNQQTDRKTRLRLLLLLFFLILKEGHIIRLSMI